MKRFIPIRNFLVGSLLIAYLTPALSAEKPDSDPVVASVNGEPILKSSLNAHKKTLPAGGNDQMALDDLIQREVIYQYAISEGLDKKPEVMAQLLNTQRNTLVNIFVNDYFENNPVSDDEIKKVYTANLGKNKQQEYHARHILLDTENEAIKIIKKLEKGKDFAKLAEKHSTGPSHSQGGDLGWFTADKMVKPFSEATSKLKKGEFTKAPVKTQFGWHIVLLEDSRDVEPESFDQAKGKLSNELMGKKIESLIKKLMDKAKVTYP